MFSIINRYFDELKNMFKEKEQVSLMDRKHEAGLSNKTLVLHPAHADIKRYIDNNAYDELSDWGMQFISEIQTKITDVRSYNFEEYEALLDSIEDSIDVDSKEIPYFGDLSDEEIFDWFDDIAESLQEAIDFREHIIKLNKYRSAITARYTEIQNGLAELTELRLTVENSSAYSAYINKVDTDYTSYEDYIATVSCDLMEEDLETISYAEMTDEAFRELIEILDGVIGQTRELIDEAKYFIEIDSKNQSGGQLPFEANTLDELDTAIREEREKAEKEKEERVANASKSISMYKRNTSAGTGGFAKMYGKNNAKQDESKTAGTNINDDTNADGE